MLNSRKLFFLPILRKNIAIRNFTTQISQKQKNKIEEKLNRELTNEETQALEAQNEGFQKLVDFFLKREMYTWEDYRQQIIVKNNFLNLYIIFYFLHFLVL
jgi:23S rRNA maturation-related 3'-5' exoribonuclease YhaM